MQTDSSVRQDRLAKVLEAFGLTVEERDVGYTIVQLPQARDEQRGGGGTSALNGGVIAYMFDCALGLAVASAVRARSSEQATELRQVTINLNISYLRAAFGDRFAAHGKVSQLGRNIAFATGSFYDEQGNICATAQGVWRIFAR